jgi:hypothetical protein
MLEILDQLPDSFMTLAGWLSEITTRAVAYGKEGAGRFYLLCFAHTQS